VNEPSRPVFAALFTLLLFAAPAERVVAQRSVEMVSLSSGEVHEARRTAVNEGILLETSLGSIVVDKKEIVGAVPSVGAQAEFDAAIDGLHPNNVAGQFAAAKLAASKGLWTATRASLNRVLEIDPDHEEARALVASYAARFRVNAFEGEKNNGDVKAVKDWLEKAGDDPVAAVYAIEKTRTKSAEVVLRPALKALREPKPWARFAGANVVARCKFEPERIKPLYRAALVDAAPHVRRECVRALKGTNDPVFVGLFARNLYRAEQAVRMTAAEALGELGMKEAIEPLLAAASGEPRAPRSFISVTTQRAYVKDFDVEVAQGAIIADPIVDVVQDGSVLEASVVSILIERRVYFTALRRLTGLAHGDDLNAWKASVAAR
jgi:hypothetical protein